MSEPLSSLRHVNVTRYVTPLREGGSLPAIVEADDGLLYVLKFRGAGQGPKALIADLIGGEIARALGFRVPEIVFAHLDEAFGRTEGDQEIQDLLKASTGLNLALRYLSGTFTFDPAVIKPDAKTASQIVWLDLLLLNVDRTAKNTNMLWWNEQLWLIDHGASFYFHHSWSGWEAKAQQPFAQIKDHVLMAKASELVTADMEFRKLLTPGIIRHIVSLIPDEWLITNAAFNSPEEQRQAYVRFIELRLEYLKNFVNSISNEG